MLVFSAVGPPLGPKIDHPLDLGFFSSFVAFGTHYCVWCRNTQMLMNLSLPPMRNQMTHMMILLVGCPQLWWSSTSCEDANFFTSSKCLLSFDIFFSLSSFDTWASRERGSQTTQKHTPHDLYCEILSFAFYWQGIISFHPYFILLFIHRWFPNLFFCRYFYFLLSSSFHFCLSPTQPHASSSFQFVSFPWKHPCFFLVLQCKDEGREKNKSQSPLAFFVFVCLCVCLCVCSVLESHDSVSRAGLRSDVCLCPSLSPYESDNHVFLSLSLSLSLSLRSRFLVLPRKSKKLVAGIVPLPDCC